MLNGCPPECGPCGRLDRRFNFLCCPDKQLVLNFCVNQIFKVLITAHFFGRFIQQPFDVRAAGRLMVVLRTAKKVNQQISSDGPQPRPERSTVGIWRPIFDRLSYPNKNFLRNVMRVRIL